MKLYDKLKEIDLVENYKEFLELIHIRAIFVNNLPVTNPMFDILESDKIRVGIKEV